MKIQVFGRIVAIVLGAAALFGLQRGLGLELYIAIGGGIVAYGLTRFAFAWFAPPPPPQL